MSLVQDLDNDVYLMYLFVVSQLFPHTAEDLGERSLAQTLTLKCSEKHSFIVMLKTYFGKEVESIFSGQRDYFLTNTL